MDNTQNIISFCTGYGGLEIGIKRAGVDVRTVCYNEIEAFAQANLVAKIEEGRLPSAPIWTDLKTFPASIFRGKVHGLIGGYPCQPFSSAGKRKGEEDPRHLWPYILKHIRAIRPVWCFWENVAGHTTMGLWRVLSDLEEEGYRVATGIFSAEEVGAPHQRKRVFILAKLPNARSPYSGEVQLTEGRTEEDTKEQESNCNGNQWGTRKGDAKRRDGDWYCNSCGLLIFGGCGCDHGEMQCKECGEWTYPFYYDLPEDGCQHCGAELANPTSARKHGELRDFKQEKSRNNEHDCNGETAWPARPGEEQYEWEEPRVTEAQSELGGATHGTQHRVDRLRLLGNGVVPQTAELAWKTLWKELNAQ